MADQDKEDVPKKPPRRQPVIRTGSDGLVTILKATKGSEEGLQSLQVRAEVSAELTQKLNSSDRTGNPSDALHPQKKRIKTSPAFFDSSVMPGGNVAGNGAGGPALNGASANPQHNGQNGVRKSPLLPPRKLRHRNALKSDSSDSCASSKSDSSSSGSVFRSTEVAAAPSVSRESSNEPPLSVSQGRPSLPSGSSEAKRPLMPPSHKSRKSPARFPSDSTPPSSPHLSESTSSSNDVSLDDAGSKGNTKPLPLPPVLPGNLARNAVTEEPTTHDKGQEGERDDIAELNSDGPVFKTGNKEANMRDLQLENEALRRQIFHLTQQKSNLTDENQLLQHISRPGDASSLQNMPAQSSPARSNTGSPSACPTPPPPNLASIMPTTPRRPSPPASSMPTATRRPSPPASSMPTATRRPSSPGPSSPNVQEGGDGVAQDVKQIARMQLGRAIQRAKASSPDVAPKTQPHLQKANLQTPVSATEAVESPEPSLISPPVSPLSPLSSPSPTQLVSCGLSSQAKRKKDHQQPKDKNGGEEEDNVSSEKTDEPSKKTFLPQQKSPILQDIRTSAQTKTRQEGEDAAKERRTAESCSTTHRSVTSDEKPDSPSSSSFKPTTTQAGHFTGKLSNKSQSVSEAAKRFQPTTEEEPVNLPKPEQKPSLSSDTKSQSDNKQVGSTEVEVSKGSVSSISESDEVFSSREHPQAVAVEAKRPMLPRVAKSESQVLAASGKEAAGKSGVMQKRIPLKSDNSWIKRKKSIGSEDVDSDRSSGALQRSESPAGAAPRPYRSHAPPNTPTPPPPTLPAQPTRPTPHRPFKTTSSQPALPSTTFSVRSKPTTPQATKPALHGQFNGTHQLKEPTDKRGRGASISDNKSSKSKRRGGGKESKAGLTRSSSDESLQNTLTREKVAPLATEQHSSGRSSAPKLLLRPWKEPTGEGGTNRPTSMFVDNERSPPRLQGRAWGGDAQEDDLTTSCTVPTSHPSRDKSPKQRFKKSSESNPLTKKGSIFGRLKGKTRGDKGPPRLPVALVEEDEEHDSSSEDEKGGTIKYKPKLRPVSVRRASQVEDDFDLTYPQLFERVFVVGLKQDSTSKKLVTEVTYTFPPRPSAETSRDETMEAIPQFCFPSIEQWKPTTKYKSETFSFVLTNMVGSRRFGYCRRLLPSGRGSRLPEVTCLISPLGCFSLYEKILDHIEERRQVSASAVFTFLKAIVANPFPKPGRSVQVRAFSARGSGMETVTFTRPLDSRLEHVDFSLLFSALSTRKIIQLFSSVLMERRIILCASNLSLLTGCAHALLALLYPFEWQHVFIPVLPGTLIDFCCSPLPYIIGMNPSLIKSLDDMETMEEALVVDLDRKKFAKKIGDEVSILPSKLFQFLEHSLNSSVISGEYQKPASRRANSSRADEIVINTFLIFFVYLYGDYKDYMKRRPDGALEFQKKAYEGKFSSKSIRRFLDSFHMTQMFDNFIEQRENPSKAETTAQSTFERHSIPEMKERCMEIEIFSSKSKISRWRMRKRN